MRSTPSSTARRSTRTHSARSAGSPQIPGPVRRIAPKPSRCTVRSAISNVPEAWFTAWVMVALSSRPCPTQPWHASGLPALSSATGGTSVLLFEVGYFLEDHPTSSEGDRHAHTYRTDRLERHPAGGLGTGRTVEFEARQLRGLLPQAGR